MTHTADKLDLKECLAYAKPLFTYGLSFMRKWLLKDSDSGLPFSSRSLIGLGHTDPWEEFLCLTGAYPQLLLPLENWSFVTNNGDLSPLPFLIPSVPEPLLAWLYLQLSGVSGWGSFTQCSLPHRV